MSWLYIYSILYIFIQLYNCDKVCEDQNKNHIAIVKQNTWIHKYVFSAETKHSIQLTWTGDNKKVILLVTTQEVFLSAAPSTVYRSTDDGVTFTEITSTLTAKTGDKNAHVYVRKANGLQRNPHNTSIVYIIAHGGTGKRNSLLYRSHDNGVTWDLYKLPFLLDGVLHFHPKASRKEWILARDHGTDELFATTDHGTNWIKLHQKVHKYSWGTSSKDSDSTVLVTYQSNKLSGIFKLFSKFQKPKRILKRTEDFRAKNPQWRTLQERVYSFKCKGDFVYVSVMLRTNDGRRRLKVSTDGCKHFNDVQLPTVTSDRFYSIVDMSEGLVFMHVDNPGDTGFGTLYTSAADGIVFSESLKRHLFPNYMPKSDFHKVQSLNGTFMATVMHEDNSMHTVITHDRGAEWNPMPRPATGVCKDKTKPCHLQVSNSYAMGRGVRAVPPLSIPNAPGLVLLHGHIAAALQTTLPDVYVSSDGGYTWDLALHGPHHYTIGDHGGLLAAVPAVNATPKELKFSTDEGRCWHTIKFTNEDIVFTGLLSEPGGKAMSVATWGFGMKDKKWRIHVFDFRKLVTTKCEAKDYVNWKPHSGECVSGMKFSIEKLKKDSWCYNGHSRLVKSNNKPCPCTKLDYECEFGYWRKVNQKNCERNPNVKMLDICVAGNNELIKGSGYRKLPGNQCSGGWKPKLASQKVFVHGKKCSGPVVEAKVGSHSAHKSAPSLPAGVPASRKTTVALVVSLILIALIVVGVVLYVRQRAKRNREIRFKFSLLNNAADDDIIQPDTRGNQPDVGLLGATSNQHPGGYTGIAGVSNGAPANNKYVVPVPLANGRVDALRQQTYHDDSDVDLIE